MLMIPSSTRSSEESSEDIYSRFFAVNEEPRLCGGFCARNHDESSEVDVPSEHESLSSLWT